MRTSSVLAPAVSASVVRYGGNAFAGVTSTAVITQPPPSNIPRASFVRKRMGSVDGREQLESVEVRDTVRLRPYADPAGPFKGRVLDLEQRLVVERHDEPRAHERDAQRAPALGGNWLLDTVLAALADRRQRRPSAALDLVKHDVAFESVRAHEVVVVLVEVSPDEAGGAIDVAGHGLETNRDDAVLHRIAGKDRQGKSLRSRVLRKLREDSRACRRRRIRDDLPPWIGASVRLRDRPAVRRRANRHAFEVDDLRLRRGERQQREQRELLHVALRGDLAAQGVDAREHRLPIDVVEERVDVLRRGGAEV